MSRAIVVCWNRFAGPSFRCHAPATRAFNGRPLCLRCFRLRFERRRIRAAAIAARAARSSLAAALFLLLLQCGAPSDPTSNGSDGADGGKVYCVLSDGPQPTNTFWWAWDENAPAVDALHDPCPAGAECAVGDEAVKDGHLNPATRIGTCER
jgi:hypothetical protein